MSDLPSEVVAILVKTPTMCGTRTLDEEDAIALLATLATAGYAVVKVPEGVTVEHGWRLVHNVDSDYRGVYVRLYAIEPPEAATDV